MRSTTLFSELLAIALGLAVAGCASDGGSNPLVVTTAETTLGVANGVITHAAGTDIFFRLPAIRMAEAQLTHQPNNTFLYRFDWPPPAPVSPDNDLGAMHASELGFMFGSGNEGWTDIYGPDPLPRQLMEQMMDAWLAFAKTGNPNHSNMRT